MEALPVLIVGAGPAGLMAAERLLERGIRAEVCDAMPSAARKFLMAGKGGMNITHSEPFEAFCRRYGAAADWLRPQLAAFGAEQIRAWMDGLGVDSFVGSSGRVFPREMKAAPLLRAWIARLRAGGVHFHMRHRWLGLQPEEGSLRVAFDTPEGPRSLPCRNLLLALGGGSWARLGSDGSWVAALQAAGVDIAPLRPANCGFELPWSEHFRSRFAGQPLKAVGARVRRADGSVYEQRGECLVTGYGIEGGLIYALSAPLRDALEAGEPAVLELDLAPGRSEADLARALAQPRGRDSLANHLRRRVGIDGLRAGLLREVLSKEAMEQPAALAAAIKALPLRPRAPRPLDEAISSAGGVCLPAVDEHLMLRALPGVFCAGEMLDWEAPTGGYLLSACFATGRTAAEGIARRLQSPAG